VRDGESERWRKGEMGKEKDVMKRRQRSGKIERRRNRDRKIERLRDRLIERQTD